jgi:hypothetical protein
MFYGPLHVGSMKISIAYNSTKNEQIYELIIVKNNSLMEEK